MALVNPERPMATITKILNKASIKDADNIELYTVYGWNVVGKKDEFQKDDLCVYVVIDSIFPEDFKKTQFLEGKPLKTRFIRDVCSQGLIFSLSWLAEERGIDITALKEGDDVTAIIGIKKWISKDELAQYSSDTTNTKFPSYVPKTDEPRIQNHPELLDALKEKEIVITRKEDGCSATYVYDATTQEFMVCSRNYVIQMDASTKQYFSIETMFNIKEKLSQYGKSLALQGEIVGPGINGNRLKLRKLDFRVFNIFDIENQSYVSTNDMVKICQKLNFNTVPILYIGKMNEITESVDTLIAYAETIKYDNNIPAEGIVVRTNTPSPRISFKVISNKYLSKHKL
jgi:RNA ligase (TIGR02306 family)